MKAKKIHLHVENASRLDRVFETDRQRLREALARRPSLSGKLRVTIGTDGDILDEGTLYVAKFLEDGSGEWFPLDLGSQARFRITLSRASGGALPDQLSLFLLTSGTAGVPLFATTDATGAGALATFDLQSAAAPKLEVYAAAAPNSPSWTVLPVPT